VSIQGEFPFRFFVVTFAWSWLIWLPLVLGYRGVGPIGRDTVAAVTTPLTLLAAFGPALGAVYSMRTLDGWAAVRRSLRGLLDLRLGWRATLGAIVMLGGCTCAAWILPEAWGAPRLGAFMDSLTKLPVYFLAMVLIGGGQEELGWRGYILDPLEDRLGPLLGNFVLGTIWGLWHLPLFFLPFSGQAMTPLAGFIVLTIGWSWIFAWIREASGRRTASGPYAHGLANAATFVFPTLIPAGGVLQTRYWIWVTLIFATGLLACLARRRRRQP